MKTYPLRVLPLLLAGVFSSALADEDIFFAELPVVASVRRLQQRLADAPASVTVIDREMIRAAGIRSLNDIFRLVPGFQTFAHSDTSARVNYHGITDHNDYSPRVQVLVDGRSLHSPLFQGGMNWGLLPVALEDIDHIEVVRGSNSVSYGTNAFLGVINIATIDPSVVRGVSISGNKGNQGISDYTLRTGGQFGESGNYRLTYQEVGDNGLKDSYDWRDSYQNRRLDARFDYALNLRDSLELGFGKVEGRFTRGRLDTDTVPFTVDPSDPMRALKESSAWMQLRWLRALSEGADLSLRYTFSEDRGDSSFINASLPAGYRKRNEAGDWGRRHEIEATHNFSPFDRTRLVWGASWRHDEVSSNTTMRGEGSPARQVWRAFANGEWKPEQWLTFNLGVSNEHDSLAGTHVSPRTSLAFHLTPENTLRVGYAQAWRTSSILAYRANHGEGPDLGDVYQIGNKHLPAERLDSWELGYLGDWRDWRMSLDVRHFREKVRDRLMLIQPAPNVPDSEQSIQDIRISGYEFQWKWQPLDLTRLMFNHTSQRLDSRLSANGEVIASIPGSQFLSPRGIPRYEKYEQLANESAPRQISSFMLMQKLPYGLEFSLSRYWVGSMKWTRNTSVDKYNRTDARLAYPFSIAGQRGEIAFTVQSLDGAHIEQRKSDDDPKARVVDRRQWISLRLDF
jgi:iron complex outermembrane receptor protein